MTKPTCEDLVAQRLGHDSRAEAPLEIQLAADYYCYLGFHPDAIASQFHMDGKLSQLVRELRLLGIELSDAEIEYCRAQLARGARISDVLKKISERVASQDMEALPDPDRPRGGG